MADGLEALAADIALVPDRAMGVLADVAKEGGKAARDVWREQWRHFKSAPHLHRAVTFDVFRVGDQILVEVGPDKQRKTGALGNLIEYGSVNNSPHPGGPAAQARATPLIARLLADRAGDLLGG